MPNLSVPEGGQISVAIFQDTCPIADCKARKAVSYFQAVFSVDCKRVCAVRW